MIAPTQLEVRGLIGQDHEAEVLKYELCPDFFPSVVGEIRVESSFGRRQENRYVDGESLLAFRITTNSFFYRWALPGGCPGS